MEERRKIHAKTQNKFIPASSIAIMFTVIKKKKDLQKIKSRLTMP
jgi:hypothetical protein